MSIEEKIQKLNALHSKLKSLNQLIAKNEEQLAIIDSGQHSEQKEYTSYDSVAFMPKFWAKPQHIRHALTHAIEDLKADAREIDQQLAQLIK